MNTANEPVYRIEAHETIRAADALADAFSEEEFIKRMKLDPELVHRMYQMPVSYYLRHGAVYGTSQACEGVMVFCPDAKANMKFRDILTSGLLFRSLGLLKLFTNKTVRKLFATLEKDRKNLDIGPYYYLCVLGVRRAHQGKGFGSRLLSFLLEKADREEKSVYLETQTEENVRLYEKFGFKVVKMAEFSEWCRIWEMVRSR